MLSTLSALSITVSLCFITTLVILQLTKGKKSLPVKLLSYGHRWIVAGQKSKSISQENSTLKKDELPQLDDERHSRELSARKTMYYKLHNIEQSPEILPSARNELLAFFATTLDTALKECPVEGILKLDTYSRDGLTNFLREQDEKVNQQWEDCVARRRQGAPMELFKDRDEAKWWLKQIAPVKYVDGAWLGYINRVTLPFELRPFVKNSWQVLSEELGDGDLAKNHAHVYRELLSKSGLELPAGDTADFIHPRLGINEPTVWESALAQLLISLLPHEFFPEILGFNMHFEAVTLETLKASRELKEVGLDPYYFQLHVSIDNADSGHTAIAQQAVCAYLEHTHQTKGPAAAQQAWRRVQVGYILSSGLSGKVTCPSKRRSVEDTFPRNDLEEEVIKIFKAKALVGQKIHSHSEIKIAGLRLVDWLNPSRLESKKWQMDFLDSFSRSKAWIHRGDGDKSRFVSELSWGGRMFGAFTQTETETVKKWIDAMPNSDSQIYFKFVGRTEDLTSPTESRPNINLKRSNTHSLEVLELLSNRPISTYPKLPAAPYKLDFAVNTIPRAAKFVPLWFVHPCLLETFVSIPWKTTSPFACSVVKILRAQAGFDMELGVVAGTDEANRTNSLGLVEIGVNMLRDWRLPEVGSLKEVLNRWESQPAAAIIDLAMRPFAHKGLLVGMAMAFSSFHGSLAKSNLLCQPSREALSRISQREVENLEDCLGMLDESERNASARGYWFAVNQLRSCFEESDQ
ncbi:MAG: hypothetical protein LQ351_007694 [Letrouitia transgressa]|nr:MAG: hypothetical protein LQ351_007694 [Letrouitia transgressa]